MRKISDTIARLAAMRQRGEASEDARPGQRLATLDDFGSNPGALQARFYLPDALPEDAPLVVVLHGCTQNAADYDRHSGWSQLADRSGFALLFPEQQRANNPNLCFNWFLPADVARDKGEALSIRQMIEAMVVAHGLDRKRIFVTGLSAGGAMAGAMLAAYPDLFAGGGIIAGLAYGSASTVPEAFDRMRGHGIPSRSALQALVRRASSHQGPWPRVSIWQGSADQTVAPSNAEAIAAQWGAMHALPATPTLSDKTGARTRSIWRDGSGTALVELNVIAGMGHGTPLGDDGLGSPGPYMLKAGVSSTREIAAFWGIAEAGESVSVSNPKQQTADGQLVNERQFRSIDETPRPLRVDEGASAGRSEAGPHSIKKTIDDALRAAGLLR